MPFFGDCPYDDCNAATVVPEPEVFDRVYYIPSDCDDCGRTFWTRLSRAYSWNMTDADFRSRFDVDEETRKITRRPTDTGDSDGA